MPALGSRLQAVAKLDTPRVIAPCGYDQQEHMSPDPREILHVPRLFV
jgi:hypothetical protein